MRAIAFLLLAAAAAHAGSAETGIFEVPALEQKPETPAIDVPAKARQTLDALWPAVHAAQRAWPGYDVLGKPLLIAFSDGSAVLVEHPAPPAEFRRITYRGMTAYVADRGPTINFSFRLDYDFAGARVTAVREEPNDSPVLLAVHERFHDFQRRFTFTPYFRNYEVEEGEDGALATLENRALAHWLETRDAQAVLDFAALRLRRRALFPATAAETSEENLEGTACYIEAAAEEAVKGATVARDTLLVKLRSRVEAKDMAKLRLYAVGAVVGRILESQSPGTWQRYVESGNAISGILLDRFPMQKTEAAERVSRLTGNPDYVLLLESRRRDVENRQRRRREFRLRYDSQPGRRVELRNKGLNGGFQDDGDWFDYADGTRLHEHVIEWVGAGLAGRFRLSDRMVLESHRGADRVLEFFAGPDAEILVDGRPWAQGQAAREFRSLSIMGPGVDVKLDAGRVESRGDGLAIVPAGAD